MLVQLSIRDIVLIDRLDLMLEGGLSVLTGETGAGKSILLDAFALALGARGDGSLVRHGQAQGQVTAVFHIGADHPVRTLLQQNEIADEGELILRRVQMADGRTRALINDQPVSVQVLRMIGASLVEIHGQHDDRALTDPAAHRALLDAFGGHGPKLKKLAQAHATWREARDARDELVERIAKARQEADYLRHAFAELDTLAPEPGEEQALADRRQVMMAAEKIMGDIRDAYDAVAGEASPIPALSSAMRRLERRTAQAPQLVEASVKALEDSLQALELARDALDQAQRDADFDPRELERVEERLFALRAAARKHNVLADDLAALRDKFAQDLEALDAGERNSVALEAAVQAAEADYLAQAKALSAARAKIAKALEKAVAVELPPLKLERARFMVHLETDVAGRSPEGQDRVEFWVETNPGSRPGPMLKVASGGELSRFLLALKVCLADRGSAPTLVFDEIDTGVGGAVADAIGQRLARLSHNVQVLSVTHAPQVAARAKSHFLIAKDLAQDLAKDGAKDKTKEKGAEKRVATRVTMIDQEHRREEIARMLAGATITDEARAAASKLLEGAH
jgi:DNA repair protein RecN (Recombination protein N)